LLNVSLQKSDTALPGLARFFRRSETAQGYALLAPALGVLVLLLAAPIVLLALYSLWNQNGLNLDTAPTLGRYAEVFAREGYRTLFLRSIAISSIVTVITVLLAYPMAYFVAFKVTRGKFVWLLLLSIPFWTSYLLRVFAWKVILGFNGLINSGLVSLGLISQPLEFLLYNPTAVVLTLVHAYAAFAILPIYVSLEKIDRSLLEAASDLGDGAMRRFFRVTLPLSLPGVIGAAVLIFVPVTGDYVTPALVGGSDGVMISSMVQVQFTRTGNWPLGAALAISSMAAVGVLAAITVQAIRLAVARIR
jgi:spermidine/putrescine transport system permease protein